MKTNVKILSAIFFSALATSSCTKEKVEPAKKEVNNNIVQLEHYEDNCRMSAIVLQGVKINLYYNSDHQLIKFGGFEGEVDENFIIDGNIDLGKDGRPIKMSTVNENRETEIFEFTYHDAERKVLIEHKNAKAEIVSTRVVYVDAQQNIVKVEYDAKDDFQKVLTYTYASSGNLIAHTEKTIFEGKEVGTDSLVFTAFDDKKSAFPYVLQLFALSDDVTPFYMFGSKHNITTGRALFNGVVAGDPVLYRYTYDANGLATAMEQLDYPDGFDFKFEYQCF